METAWMDTLGKDKRGSRPRCVLLVDGPRHLVAAGLTDLVGLANVTVSRNDFRMPRGKPVRMGAGWDKKPVAEARLDRDDRFVGPEVRRDLRDWWLSVVPRANTPNWDVASTCKIEGREGLLLVEAKAHRKELSDAGKPKPSTTNGCKNHERIGSAIEQANAGLGSVTRRTWGLSRDDHYQLANRFAWSWKLAQLGVPVVLLYLGFLNADDMTPHDALFRSKDDWARALRDHARGVVDDSCWGNRLDVDGTPFRPLIRAIQLDTHSVPIIGNERTRRRQWTEERS